jgi:hypothetical protein
MAETTTEKKQKPAQPPMFIHVKIQNSNHKIEFPSNDKLIRMERIKHALTGGLGSSMISEGTNASYDAYMAASAIAMAEVVLTDFIKGLNVPLLELNPLQTKELVKAYEEYHEWIEKWREFLKFD